MKEKGKDENGLIDIFHLVGKLHREHTLEFAPLLPTGVAAKIYFLRVYT